MWIDFTIAIILIICILIGERRGFLLSFINTFGWIISLAAGYLLRPALISYIDANTTLRQDITATISEYIQTYLVAKAAGLSTGDTIPGYIASQLTSAADKVLESTADAAAVPVAEMLITILSFWAIVIAAKFIIFIIERILKALIGSSKVISSFNGIMGMLMGLARGCFISYILLLLACILAVTQDWALLCKQVETSMVVSALAGSGLIPLSDSLFSILEMKI